MSLEEVALEVNFDVIVVMNVRFEVMRNEIVRSSEAVVSRYTIRYGIIVVDFENNKKMR